MESTSVVEAVYMGRTVRFRFKGPRPPGVPRSEVYGLVMKVVEMHDQTVKLVIETWASGGCSTSLFDPSEVEFYALSEGELRQHLLGRQVYFPRSSGIGISFPKGASDYGRIITVNYNSGRVMVVVAVEVVGSSASFVTPVDFTQCDLLPKPKKGGSAG